jgi:hypothetical protein
MPRLRSLGILVVAGVLMASAFGIIALEGAAGVFSPSHPSAGPPPIAGTSFPPSVSTFVVSFVEAGLPTGLSWTVTITNSSSGASISNSSTSSTLTFTVPNGTYTYLIENATNSTTLFVGSPQTGPLVVSGPGAAVEFYYVPYPISVAEYTVTFVERGLPCMTNWSVVLVNATGSEQTNNSTTGSVAFSVPNGTYTFTVASVQTHRGEYVASPASGPVTVDGKNVTIDVTFTLETSSGGCTGMGPASSGATLRSA